MAARFAIIDEIGFVPGGDERGTAANVLFAIGDVRSGSVKRVASAAGEGAAVIADVHRYLADRAVQ